MLTENEVLERAFRALDELVGRRAAGAPQGDQSESNTSRRCISETPEVRSEIQEELDAGAGVHTVDIPTASLKLKGQAVELWRDGRRFFLLADDEDALEAMRRFGAHRGEVWTSGELELVASIPDQTTRDEVESFKRQMDGCLMPDAADEGVSPEEWQGQMLNHMFQEQGVTGQPGKITVRTVKHGAKGGHK
jgi:hypothetical protein